MARPLHELRLDERRLPAERPLVRDAAVARPLHELRLDERRLPAERPLVRDASVARPAHGECLDERRLPAERPLVRDAEAYGEDRDAWKTHRCLQRTACASERLQPWTLLMHQEQGA